MEWKIYSEKSIFITGTKDELEKVYKFISAMADSSNEQGNCIKPDVVVRLFDPKIKPRQSKDDPAFSEDVFIIDENNLNGLAYYSFEAEQWRFLTDTGVDYDEVGAETKWKWYYPVVSSKDVI